ncbi:MAG: penicillin-binding protein 1C [Acidobacteriota bacterium]|jgi:penicillin-binding protein 1C|nr:penicillin-binding protein 1C [Acidobacteriota bacterium]
MARENGTDAKNRVRIRNYRKVAAWGLACLAIACLAPLAAGYRILHSGVYAGPSFDEVRASHSVTETTLVDRHGEVLHEQRTENRGRRLEWTPLGEVSPALTAAILAAEDRRFHRHHGADWLALARASLGVMRPGGRGASTISMQLAARLDPGLHPADGRRTMGQKWRQVRAALALERRWTKDQILECWLNLVSYRGELQGVAAASGGLFDKRPHGLTQTEALVLAALVRAPNADSGRVARRAAALAEAMRLPVDGGAVATLAAETLNRPYRIRRPVALAYHVMQRLLRRARDKDGKAPARLVSTLDRDLQQFAAETLRRHVQSMGDRNMHDGALLVLDNATGDVLAYVGNTGEGSTARYVDGVEAPRQAGSTLKPFFYGAALDRRILTAATLLDDSPLDIPVGGGVYQPSNYDGRFHGPVSVRTALASSLNIPAVRALGLLGVENGVAVLGAAGFGSLEDADYYGLSLALGAADVKLWDLTNAYRALANGGAWRAARLTFEEEPAARRRVLSPEAAFVISDILSDRESRSQTFDLESPLATRFWTAVKTGTSKDMRDNWCIGYSDRHTVGVWVGNFSGEPMWNVSGISGAAPAWVEVMNWLNQRGGGGGGQGGDARANPPAGVVQAAVPPAEPGDPERREWFLSGTEGALVAGAVQPPPRIAYPAPDAVVALDPDIPPDDQKLFFEAQGGAAGFRWRLDGEELGDAAELLLWTPVVGRHVLTLANRAGRALDEVTFEVRGAPSTK